MTKIIDEDHLDAVARILDRDGRSGLSLSAIAEEAGVSRVTLHRRGAKIDDYLAALLLRTSDDIRRSLWPVLTSSEPAVVRLEQALVILCQSTEANAGIVAAIFRQPALPVPDRPGTTTSLEFTEPFERLLRDGNLDGTLHSDDPPSDATLVANATAWSYLQMRHGHQWDPETATSRVVRMTMSYLLPAG